MTATLNLLHAGRFDRNSRVAIVGSGGKSTALFQLGRQFSPPVFLAVSTHLSIEQGELAERHIVLTKPDDLDLFVHDIEKTVYLFTGYAQPYARLAGVSLTELDLIEQIAEEKNIPLVIEADGSRCRPLKAPAAHEPVIPSWVNAVMVVAGLSGLGKPLSDDWVHRPELFSETSGLAIGSPITMNGLIAHLLHPHGGMKGLPSDAKKIILLNQADDPSLQSSIQEFIHRLLHEFDSVIACSLAEEKVHACFEPAAAIILAAGASSRLGRPKTTLDWHGKPMVRHVAENALQSGYSPVIVVTGSEHEAICAGLSGLNLTIVKNEAWAAGQSSSIKTGLAALPSNAGCTIFLLADQPQIPMRLMVSLLQDHYRFLSPITSTQVMGRRANPVMFDRVTFPEFSLLSGEMGGRVLFSRFPVRWVEWEDDSILLDVDSEDDYQKLKGLPA